jgi:type IV pilus assembly protein PilX
MQLNRLPERLSHAAARRQRGVVLMIAMIMLVAMSLAGIALVRSVYTTNIIAGNLAFQQAATHAADTGIETAIAWLAARSRGAELYQDVPASGYLSSRQDPNRSGGQTWSDYWEVLKTAGAVRTLTQGGSGNTVSFVIHRLCNAPGDPFTGVGCVSAPPTPQATSGSKGAGVIDIQVSNAVYYRITARVAGPRSTASFVQAVVLFN